MKSINIILMIKLKKKHVWCASLILNFNTFTKDFCNLLASKVYFWMSVYFYSIGQLLFKIFLTRLLKLDGLLRASFSALLFREILFHYFFNRPPDYFFIKTQINLLLIWNRLKTKKFTLISLSIPSRVVDFFFKYFYATFLFET